MNDSLQGLEPSLLWEHFLRVSRIPRGSGNEAGVREYVLARARERGLALRIDSAGNALVRKPASPGRENGPVVVLQSHMDMVCVKNRDHAHDFLRDPIRWVRAGESIRAMGTSLGADNGVGVAAVLAVMESPGLVHGPLDLLFTVDEETGLTGARELAAEMLRGRILLNLDSEEEGTLYIGCAGGMYTDLDLDVDREEAPPGEPFFRIRVGGLFGGHSGLNIHEGRGNAVRLAGRILADMASPLRLRLSSLEGGEKRNAIPRECDAVFCLPEDRVPLLRQRVVEYENRLRSEFRGIEDGIFVRLEAAERPWPDYVLALQGQERLLSLLLELPHGVVAMNPTVPDTVETSTNLAAVRCGSGKTEIWTKQRSSTEAGLETASARVTGAAERVHARVKQGGRYPAWRPNPESDTLKTARSAYFSLFGREPSVTVIHAGLECGIIGGKVPGMDMLSFGPTIRSPHSPEESVEIPSVSRFWDFLLTLLRALSS
jgi:dipeptidase D